MTVSRSPHVSTNDPISFLFMAEYYSIVYMYYIFIHLSVDGHLGCFHDLAIVNSAAVNIGVHVSFFFFNLFIYFWLHWVFVTVRRLSLVVVSGGYSLLRCMGFSLRWLLLLQSMGSRCAGFSSCGTRALEHRLSSCGARA